MRVLAGFIAAVVGVVGLATLAVPSPVHAQAVEAKDVWCVYEGQSVWRDRRAAQNALARITLDIGCFDGTVSAVRVKAETRCGRALCSWSFAEQASVEADAVQAVFLTFTATRSMRLLVDGDRLSVLVRNDYNQPERPSDELRALMQLER